MNKLNLNISIQLLGVFGVIGSLIFVGLELQQSQRIALSTQQQARSALTVDIITNFNTIGADFQSIYWEQNLDYDLPENEIALRNVMHSAWSLYENDYYQFTQGLMDDVTWSAKKKGIQKIYNHCKARVIFHSRKSVFSREFKAVIESFEDKCGQKV